MSIQTVLVVDDDSQARELVAQAIQSLGLQTESTTGSQAPELLSKKDFDAVVVDLSTRGRTGGPFWSELKKSFPDLPVVLTANADSAAAAVSGVRQGAWDFFLKPFSTDALRLVFDRLASFRRLERENTFLKKELVWSDKPGLVAMSQAMKDLLRTAERVAGSKGTVLVSGEPGTGKSRIARFIHQKSPRKNGAFVVLNCDDFDENALEAELFGFEKGAFVGASARRAGRFELAHGGTLVIEEIGFLPAPVQAKLLRFLENESFERLGGSRPVKVDVRVIATTSRDLPGEVSRGNFREDLYYRLHVLPIQIAPLRDRRDDVPTLAEHFADFYAGRWGFDEPTFSSEVTELLSRWRWPGNVRELQDVVRRAVLLAQGATIEPRHLRFEAGPPADHKPRFTLVTDKGTYMGAISADSPLANRQLADLEREAILCTLEATRGNKTEAARRLGVTARTLSNKMRLWRELGLVA